MKLTYLAACFGLVFSTGLVQAQTAATAPKELLKKEMPELSTLTIPHPALNYEAMEKLHWKLAVASYTFFRAQTTLYDTIDILHGIGIRYIDIKPGQVLSREHRGVKVDETMPAEYLAPLLQKLKDANVTVEAYGVANFGKDEASARKTFEIAKKLGAKRIVAEPDESIFSILDKLTEEYQIDVAIHDHPKPSHYWNPDIVLAAIKGHSDRIGACADTGHWFRSGLDPVECLHKLEGHLKNSHFKDLVDGPGNKGKIDAVWGTGHANVRAQLEEVKRQGIPFEFSMEYESSFGQDLINNVAKQAEWFSAQCEEIAKDAK
jgi:sugar phosphate isomerase/epimerase